MKADIATFPSPAVFLDRDGTLNIDTGYVYRWKDWQWLPHAVSGLKKLKNAGFRLVVVSNQSGIARGYYHCCDMRKLHESVNHDLAAQGLVIDAFYCCPHHPDYTGQCACRKPEPGLILKAAREMRLDLSRSWMIGDKASDIAAGMAAGVRPILTNISGTTTEKILIPPHIPIVTNLEEAADLIICGASYLT